MLSSHFILYCIPQYWGLIIPIQWLPQTELLNSQRINVLEQPKGSTENSNFILTCYDIIQLEQNLVPIMKISLLNTVYNVSGPPIQYGHTPQPLHTTTKLPPHKIQKILVLILRRKI